MCVDFGEPFLGKMFFVAVDVQCKWPEVIQMSSTSSEHTVTALRKLFASYAVGI